MKKIVLVIDLFFLLTSCATQSSNLQPVISSQAGTPTVLPSLSETIILQDEDEGKTDAERMSSVSHNLWTKIDKEKITIYPINWLSDFTYAKDGSLWMVGGFGVIHQKQNGQQTWYSIKNELSINFFTRVAISPSSEVWIGGTNNALFRFDGNQWINEGIKFPPPFDKRGWLCNSTGIAGIDFDKNGNAWVLNDKMEIYAQAYGQWVNFPFPKNILPMAGGGGCPLGIHVISENEITIKRSGCCGNEAVGYYFDGKTWSENADYTVVDKILKTRHESKKDPINIGLIERSGFTNWQFEQEMVSPDFLMSYQEHMSLMADKDGVIWLTDGTNLYNNISGKFEALENNYNYEPDDLDIKNSITLNFGDEILYYQEGKKPYRLSYLLQNIGTGWSDMNYPSVDKWNRVWIYASKIGLTVIENGKVQILGREENLTYAGGILPLDDGRVLIGERNAVWVYDNNHWQKLIIPIPREPFTWIQDKNDELFTYLQDNDQGVIYAATATGIYKLQNNMFSYVSFVNQDTKSAIVLKDDEYYAVKLLHIQADGSIIYINNKVVAKLENGKWKSFLFDTLSIKSATVDKDGFIWVYTGFNGLIRFSPRIFDS